MDLLQLGRSLDELGKTLRWTDVSAMIEFASSSSHFWGAENTEQARQIRWLEELASPTVVLLGAVVDKLEAAEYIRAGQLPPDDGILTRLSRRAVNDLSKDAPKVEAPVKPRLSAAEIRQRYAARAKK